MKKTRGSVDQLVGACIAATVVLTSLQWYFRGGIRTLLPGTNPACWPWWPTCTDIRVFSPDQIKLAIIGFGLLGLLTTVAMLSRKTFTAAKGGLFLLTIVKLLVIGLDFKLRLNQHIMTTWATVVFLTCKDRHQALRLLVILFYFYAGIIKLTPEWLSGAALYAKPWLVPESLLPLSLYYVVVLEIVGIWALLWDRSKLAWIVLAQLAVFHIASLPVVNFFYPAVMTCLLAVFPISWMIAPQAPRLFDSLRDGLLNRSRKVFPAIVVVVVFSAGQLYAYALPGPSALMGEGRLWSLHMFDAFPICNAHETMHYTDRQSKRRRYDTIHMAPRIRCDPIVYLSRARRACLRKQDSPNFNDIDVYLESKLTTDEAMQPRIDIQNFCAKNPTYSIWRHNAWILY